MARVHFISTTLPLTTEEAEELRVDIETGLAAIGRPGDKVIFLRQCVWHGSEIIHPDMSEEEPF